MDTISCDSGLPCSSRSSADGDYEQVADAEDEKSMCGLSDLVSSCLSKNRSSIETEPFLRSSLFTGVQPTIRFYTKGTKVSKPNRKICSRVTWCHNSLLPIVMRQSLASSHFSIVDEHSFYVGYWGRHLKSAQYKTMMPYQKINHFPGAFHIGRKDRLWTHISNRQQHFGSEFDIIPRTYILPNEKAALCEHLKGHPERYVIIKPPASARGTGISVTNKMKDICMKTPIIAQHYIHRPLTINGAKFDLRFYAYCPCLEPLRVYIYNEGLVRFASVEYSTCLSTVSNKYMHLTNYSINKLAEKDGVLDSPVPKWTLSELWEYFEEKGINSVDVRQRIDDVIIKAFISCEKAIRDHMAKYLRYGFICHELFGVDILLDESLRPWLLEVNISPSLHSGTTLDAAVKGPLAKDVLNMAGIEVPPSQEEMLDADYTTRPGNLPKDDDHLVKEAAWVASYKDEKKVDPRVLKRLSSEDVRMLVSFEDEFRRKGNFELVFPTSQTAYMQEYFPEPVYANLLLQQWQIEHEADRSEGIARLEMLCRQGHLGNRNQLLDLKRNGL
ncbi:unnamed protein product [Auanema sp. JU1783]|nr:unnamed protein product [Auanema sp. JU1783]